MKMCYVLVVGVRASTSNSSSIRMYVGTRCYHCHCIDTSGLPRNPYTCAREIDIRPICDAAGPQSTRACGREVQTRDHQVFDIPHSAWARARQRGILHLC